MAAYVRAGLEDDERKALVMFCGPKRMKVNDIASKMRVSRRKVQSLLSDARRKLRAVGVTVAPRQKLRSEQTIRIGNQDFFNNLEIKSDRSARVHGGGFEFREEVVGVKKNGAPLIREKRVKVGSMRPTRVDEDGEINIAAHVHAKGFRVNIYGRKSVAMQDHERSIARRRSRSTRR
jgi:hypothetical protein